jgi:hypothetical protein
MVELRHWKSKGNEINWENCIGLCTDGANSMSVRSTGFQALVKKKALLVMWTRFMVHRQAQAYKYE